MSLISEHEPRPHRHLSVLRNAEDAGDEVDQPGGVIDDDERIEYRATGGNRRLGKQNLTVHTSSLAAGRTVSGTPEDAAASLRKALRTYEPHVLSQTC